MSERSCPVSGVFGARCPASSHGGSRAPSRAGPRGCSFSGYVQPGDLHAALDIPKGVDVDEWLRSRERKTITDVLYSNMPSADYITGVKNVDDLTANDRDLLSVALGAPARQVLLRAEEIGPRTGWKDGYMTAEYGFCPPDPNQSPAALANSPGRIWSDLCERMPGVVARGRVRESVAALPVVEGTEDVIPDRALWAAVVALGMLCSIYRYEDNHDGNEGVSVNPVSTRPDAEMSDELGPELVGIPKSIGLPYWQVSRRVGRGIPHLTFYDQASYNTVIRNPTSTVPYVGRFSNTDLRWPMFGERTEIAFLKGCADTSASFQHGPDAIAACQEHVMNRNVEGLLTEMIRLKEILERMPNAFHSISTNPNAGENWVSANEWVRWGLFSKPLSKRCPAASGLQFPPYLLMDAFLGRKKYDSFLGKEGLHLRAWLPSNLRAFIAAVEYHYSIPDFVRASGDPRLRGVLDGIVEAYTGERGFMGTHRYKVFGILEVASKTGRTETNGASGGADATGRPWELVHQQFADAMRERLEPYRGSIAVEPHQMRGTFEECRYRSRIVGRSFVDSDPTRSIALVTLDLENTGITFQPGDRLAVMPLNRYEEVAKVAAALGLHDLLDRRVALTPTWSRFAEHFESTDHNQAGGGTSSYHHRHAHVGGPRLAVRDVLRRGHLAPLTKELVLKVHSLLRASSNTVLQVLATEAWPVNGSLGDLLQAAVRETPVHIWDSAFDLDGDMAWLGDLVPVEVPRTYSVSNHPDELLPSTVDLTISRSEYKLCATFSGDRTVTRCGVGSGFMNPPVGSAEDYVSPPKPVLRNDNGGDDDDDDDDDEVLIGVSRPVAFQLPIDGAAPCAYFAGGSGIAPFRSFWQARCGRTVGRNILFLGVQSREKFCHELELRQYVNAGLMEVHLAFSRDSRGLAHDASLRNLVEKRTDPRYIDVLIADQGATVCDLVMSKAQGGLGGYLFVCGSVAVFDSVMSGIRKAIWNNRASTSETTDMILDTAFAERRIQIDVFMSPKPLPCNLPTIPLSRLASNTGHRPGGRIWLGVHGSVYDVTDFAAIHIGGRQIIQSNAGVDCSKSFDNLAHTNNPEVSSLLTKYFIGHLTPKPEYHGCEELSVLYDLWAGYLRTTVETLVAHQFEMDDISGSPRLWYQQGMISMLGVRIFYQYQSRLLKDGFSALFGPKFQELVLKLSFTIASAEPAGTKLPDILGIVAGAKTSPDAITTTMEISQVGHLICNSEAARFQERGLVAYARRAVELDIELLEDIREEACRGMDAFDSILTLDVAPAERVLVVARFLMNLTVRMAKRLEIFYSQLARCSIYQPELETNPARTRWNLVRRRIRDGSLFIMAPDATINGNAHAAYEPARGRHAAVEFDNVLSHVQQTIRAAPAPPPRRAPSSSSSHRAMPLNERHFLRTQPPPNGGSALESHENGSALSRMTQFIDKNRRAMHRLSRIPPTARGMPLSFENVASLPVAAAAVNIATPEASSRGSSRSPSRGPAAGRVPTSLEEFMEMRRPGMLRRATSQSMSSSSGAGSFAHARMAGHGRVVVPVRGIPSPPHSTAGSPPPPPDTAAMMQSMVGKLNFRPRRGMSQSAAVMGSVAGITGEMPHHSARPSIASRPQRTGSTSSLRSFKLGALVGAQETRVPPTF